MKRCRRCLVSSFSWAHPRVMQDKPLVNSLVIHSAVGWRSHMKWPQHDALSRLLIVFKPELLRGFLFCCFKFIDDSWIHSQWHQNKMQSLEAKNKNHVSRWQHTWQPVFSRGFSIITFYIFFICNWKWDTFTERHNNKRNIFLLVYSNKFISEQERNYNKQSPSTAANKTKMFLSFLLWSFTAACLLSVLSLSSVCLCPPLYLMTSVKKPASVTPIHLEPPPKEEGAPVEQM